MSPVPLDLRPLFVTLSVFRGRPHVPFFFGGRPLESWARRLERCKFSPAANSVQGMLSTAVGARNMERWREACLCLINHFARRADGREEDAGEDAEDAEDAGDVAADG